MARGGREIGFVLAGGSIVGVRGSCGAFPSIVGAGWLRFSRKTRRGREISSRGKLALYVEDQA